MAYQVMITFNAADVKAPGHPAAPISPIFVPTNAAADMEAFDGTYYDTNVYGLDFGSAFEDFLAAQVSHPGLIAAMKKARKDGTYTMVTEDPMMETMIDELNVAMKGTGFTFEWGTGSTGETGATGETGETGPTGATE